MLCLLLYYLLVLAWSCVGLATATSYSHVWLPRNRFENVQQLTINDCAAQIVLIIHRKSEPGMSLDLLLQSIASSSQVIIKNVKSYDLKLQEVPSLLSGLLEPFSAQSTLKNDFLILLQPGFMQSYDSISNAFTPRPMSFDVDWNRCITSKSQQMNPHCASVQAFVIDVSVIGSVGAFTFLVIPRPCFAYIYTPYHDRCSVNASTIFICILRRLLLLTQST